MEIAKHVESVGGRCPQNTRGCDMASVAACCFILGED